MNHISRSDCPSQQDREGNVGACGVIGRQKQFVGALGVACGQRGQGQETVVHQAHRYARRGWRAATQEADACMGYARVEEDAKRRRLAQGDLSGRRRHEAAVVIVVGARQYASLRVRSGQVDCHPPDRREQARDLWGKLVGGERSRPRALEHGVQLAQCGALGVVGTDDALEH